MGVADNISYKQMYHFRDSFRDDWHAKGKSMPSVNDDPAINSTIKENPYASNVEIEGDEVVLQPDLSALFNAKGPKHKNGGMDVLLKPNSFVFSDDKSLALGKSDHKMLELKDGGNFDPKRNTPADVLKRNIPLKHYNGLVNNLEDKHKDDLAKKSSAMMLEKYMKTLGNIAYAQELKKGFPDGLPPFSQGTAPVSSNAVESNMDAQKQYAKYGGSINNPYKPKAQMGMANFLSPQSLTDRALQSHRRGIAPINGSTPSSSNWGLWPGDQLPVFSNRYGTSNAADKILNLDELASTLGYPGPKDNMAFQKWLYNSSPENKAIIDKWHNTYNVGPNNGMFDGKLGVRWANALRDIALTPRPNGLPPVNPNRPTPGGPSIQGPNSPAPDDTLTPNNVTGSPQKPIQASWQFTPWQKASQLYNWGQVANVRRYMPYRSHYNATYVDPALVNPEQTISDLRGTTNQQLQSLSTLNPIMRNAQASSAFGQLLNQMPSVRAQYDNQNAETLNRTRLYNAQQKNQESMVNMQNDQNYYKESVIGRQNFDNMRQFTANNAMNNTMRDVETNQRLAYNLMTVDNPAYGFDFRSGNFYRNPKDIRDVQGMLPQNSLQGMLDYAKQLKDTGLDPAVQSALLRGTLFKQIAPYFNQAQANPYGYPYAQNGYGTGYGYKKGGKVKNPYSK